jgi:hypothetical protein
MMSPRCRNGIRTPSTTWMSYWWTWPVSIRQLFGASEESSPLHKPDWSPRLGSIQRPVAYKATALPSELRGHDSLVAPPGLEPGRPKALAFKTSVSTFHHEAQWLGREDSNFQPPGSRPGTLPDCATPHYCFRTSTYS